MLSMRLAFLAPAMVLASAATPAQQVNPLRFFEGRTEGQGRVKVMFHKEYGTHTTGLGRIEPDGSLTLVQRVFDDGKPPHERRWRVRQVGPGRYTGTMTEAVGPVTIDQIGERYRSRFNMDGRLSVEQVLTPLTGGRTARNSARVRNFFNDAATTERFVRKL